jgi:cysteine sulfinate desulfinase/cysteine desulfurase-like protein
MAAMQEKRIYLDFNATTPIAPEVAAAISQALIEPFGNPSSEHWAGLPARQAVEKARAQPMLLSGSSTAAQIHLPHILCAASRRLPGVLLQ